MTARHRTIGPLLLATSSLLVAGCVFPVLEPIEGATDRGVVNLAELVLPEGLVAGSGGEPSYAYGSHVLDSSWVAYRIPIPESALSTDSRGRVQTKVHLVAGFVADGEVVDDELRTEPQELEPTDSVLFTLAYVPFVDGTTMELYGHAQSGLGAGYRNFTLYEMAPEDPLREMLLVFALAPHVEKPEAAHVAFVLRLAGEPPQVKEEEQFEAALAEIAGGNVGEALVPVASGDGVHASMYAEFPPTGVTRDVDRRMRGVDVEDDAAASAGAGSAERVITITTAQEFSATARTIGGFYQTGGAQAGGFEWSYTAPDGSAFAGDGGFASMQIGETAPRGTNPPSVAFARVEGPGTLTFSVTARTHVSALPDITFSVLAIEIDVESIFGRPVYELDPQDFTELPPVVLPALDGVAARATA